MVWRSLEFFLQLAGSCDIDGKEQKNNRRWVAFFQNMIWVVHKLLPAHPFFLYSEWGSSKYKYQQFSFTRFCLYPFYSDLLASWLSSSFEWEGSCGVWRFVMLWPSRLSKLSSHCCVLLAWALLTLAFPEQIPVVLYTREEVILFSLVAIAWVSVEIYIFWRGKRLYKKYDMWFQGDDQQTHHHQQHQNPQPPLPF